MLTFLQRWKVVNSLHRLSQRRNKRVWVQEHDLCSWIAGTDLATHRGEDTWFDKLKFRFWYLFFQVDNHDQLFQKIQNVIYDCEHIEPKWIRRTNGDDGISDHLCLSPRGNEVYPISYLWLTSDPAQKVWTAVLAGLVIWFATWRVEQIIPDEPQRIQVEYVSPASQEQTPDTKG